MIDQFKPGDVISVPFWRDGVQTTESAELLPKLCVWFYDGTALAAPPSKGITSVEEAIRVVRERYPSGYFAHSLSADGVSFVEGAMERDLLSIAIPFYSSEPALNEPTDEAGIIEWFAKLVR